MYSTTNGCTCHMIQSPGKPFLKCISCRGREERSTKGDTCRQCGVGIYSSEKEDNGGLCSECYYGE
jgi:hypothetical protein